MTIACCMWWKRKETDIFPEFQNEKLVRPFREHRLKEGLVTNSMNGINVLQHTIKYENVKYEFEVMPKRHALQLQGFLPPPHEEMEEKEESPEPPDRDVEMRIDLQ